MTIPSGEASYAKLGWGDFVSTRCALSSFEFLEMTSDSLTSREIDDGIGAMRAGPGSQPRGTRDADTQMCEKGVC